MYECDRQMMTDSPSDISGGVYCVVC